MTAAMAVIHDLLGRVVLKFADSKALPSHLWCEGDSTGAVRYVMIVGSSSASWKCFHTRSDRCRDFYLFQHFAGEPVGSHGQCAPGLGEDGLKVHRQCRSISWNCYRFIRRWCSCFDGCVHGVAVRVRKDEHDRSTLSVTNNFTGLTVFNRGNC